MRRKRLLTGLLITVLSALLLTGCWDRLEIEDQLFPVTLAVDQGERSRYRMLVRVPISAQLRSGVLGGQMGGGDTAEMLMVEADNVTQAMRTLNTGVARRITLRHLRGVVIGEELAREGVHDLVSELFRDGEIQETIGVWVARGSAVEALERARPTGEFNPGKINEGLLLVQKSLHMAPPIRLHHLLNRKINVGVDPYVAVVGLNKQITGEGEPAVGGSALAGEMDRWDKNPTEVAGTAIFRGDRLAGFLTVDETQALLALRGEMGKAYLTIPDPHRPGHGLMVRYQQENLPAVKTFITPDGPRATVRLLFEGEVLSGDTNYMEIPQRMEVEAAAKAYMEEQLTAVLAKLKDWEADPVGFGLKFRSHFARWPDWDQYQWQEQVKQLEVEATAEMRLRRFGLLHQGPTKAPTRGE